MDSGVLIAEAGGRRDGSGMKAMILGAQERPRLSKYPPAKPEDLRLLALKEACVEALHAGSSPPPAPEAQRSLAPRCSVGKRLQPQKIADWGGNWLGMGGDLKANVLQIAVLNEGYGL